MICYLQVNTGHWCQEAYETASRDTGRRVRQLRRAGYNAVSSPMGLQVTRVGTVKLTIVTITPGGHSDTHGLPTENWRQEVI